MCGSGQATILKDCFRSTRDRPKYAAHWQSLHPIRDPQPTLPVPLVHPEMLREIYEAFVEWGIDWEKYWELWETERDKALG
jgi:hypothetical protein